MNGKKSINLNLATINNLHSFLYSKEDCLKFATQTRFVSILLQMKTFRRQIQSKNLHCKDNKVTTATNSKNLSNKTNCLICKGEPRLIITLDHTGSAKASTIKCHLNFSSSLNLAILLNFIQSVLIKA